MNSSDSFAWLAQPAFTIDQQAQEQAQTRQQQLTKPAGSLGRLESIAQQFAGYQGLQCAQLNQIKIVVFAGDHGVCQQGVSAFPQAVTAQMVANFANGGAAISVLSRYLQADLHVVNVGTVEALPAMTGVLDRRVASGTQDMSETQAMTEQQCAQALAAGREQVETIERGICHLCVGGEMGIGNSTSAAALYCTLLDQRAAMTVGPGTGLDAAGVTLKQQVVERALRRHPQAFDYPLQALQCLGGFEIAALCGFYIAAAQKGVPILIDGFISSAAALVAVAINPTVAPWFLYSHSSAEPGHQLALQKLQVQPLLDLNMRLGEGSGAALAVPLLQAALRLHAEMATFADAGVANG